jgi:hypothetical protein
VEINAWRSTREDQHAQLAVRERLAHGIGCRRHPGVRAERPSSPLACRCVSDPEREPDSESEYGDPSHALARLLRAALASEAEAKESSRLPSAPTVARYYEATILDSPGSGAELKVISVPHTPDLVARSVLSSLPAEHRLREPGFLRDFRIDMLLEPPVLVDAILATRPDHSRSYRGALADHEFPPPSLLDPIFLKDAANAIAARDPLLYRFASRAALEPIIPVESSPLSGASLVELVKSTGASAALGYFAVGADPLLLVTVPLGVILLGGATGIAEGLKAGLAVRIASWLGGTPDQGGESRESGTSDT